MCSEMERLGGGHFYWGNACALLKNWYVFHDALVLLFNIIFT
jgi:hypothetical protein